MNSKYKTGDDVLTRIGVGRIIKTYQYGNNSYAQWVYVVKLYDTGGRILFFEHELTLQTIPYKSTSASPTVPLKTVCECGAEKSNTAHSSWCPKYKENHNDAI